MLRHFLLLIYRNFKRYKSTFLINGFGLSSGLACAILIFFWIRDEFRFDTFQEKDERLIQVMQNDKTSTGILTLEETPGLLARTLKEEMPEVEFSAALIPSSWFSAQGIISIGDNYIKVREQFADRDFFNIFSFKLLAGDRNKVLSDKNGVVISKSLALKLFKTPDNVLGKSVAWSRKKFKGEYFIAGIFDDLPVNSSQQFDLLFAYDLFLEKYPALEEWGNSDPHTYAVLKEGVSREDFSQKISTLLKRKNSESTGTLFVRGYSEKYLYGLYENGVQTGGRITYVKLFAIIAVAILVIACINFMNLATAKATTRLKEVGIKKTIGAGRGLLIAQYIGEAIVTSIISLIIACIAVGLLLPSFNQLTGKQIVFSLDVTSFLTIVGITLVTGFVAGSYPGLYLSGFSPATVLKGKVNNSVGEVRIRRALVVFQLIVAEMLIVLVMVVYRQIEFVQSKNLGYHRDNIIHFTKEGKVAESLDVFLSEVKNIPEVVSASNMGGDIIGDHGNTTDVMWDGKSPDDKIQFASLGVNYNMIELLGVEMKEGRAFSRDFGSDNANVVLNETAVKTMGLIDPIGKNVKIFGEEKQVIGVVKDFHFESLYEPVKPFFFILAPNSSKIMVKIKAGHEQEAIRKLQSFYQEYNLGLPLDFKFLDDDYQERYASEIRVSSFSKYFTVIAIIISCLGLFGLAAFTVEKRTKEIGIRKVFGSGNRSVIFLLMSDFTWMVGISLFVALPISYYIAKIWLDDFAFRINLSIIYFMIAAISTLLVTWLTVGLQTVRASTINPLKTLRSE